MTEQVEYAVVGLGALGSATAYALARAGHRVVGLERFPLGHELGASHDASRILRHSYHRADYVRLTQDAYADWADLERVSGEDLVTLTGGLDLFPPGAAIPAIDYTTAMTEGGVEYQELDRAELRRRWPQFDPPEGTQALYQADSAIVPAARTVALLQRLARAHGAELRESSPVSEVRDLGGRGIEVESASGTLRCRRLVVCADAWTNDVLAGLDHTLPLTVTLEQVTYLEIGEPLRHAPGELPLWIWMDDPSYYGFPIYGEDTVKVAEDCGGAVVTGDSRGFDPDPDRVERLQRFTAGLLPAVGAPVRSKTCLYTLTPDRDFVLDTLPGHDSVVVGLGAAHGFKFTPTFGRLLAELAATGHCDADVSGFRLDRPALTEAGHPQNWLV
jgi:monomeric sarcosine oxidase